jgi:hypothetical protein
MDDRKMPNPYQLGQYAQTIVGHADSFREKDDYAHFPERKVMGFRLPSWQRHLVWSDDQMIRFIESLWLGIPVGSYSYVQNDDPATDGLLIDGQQRMYAIERYLQDAFPVFGVKWSEVTRADYRGFMYSRNFPCYIVKSSDETFLREYYNLMNFSGVAHTADQMA